MKAKSTFLAWSVLPSPTWATGSPYDDGPGLPMTRARRQYRPRKADHPGDVGLYNGAIVAATLFGLARRGRKPWPRTAR
jgi:hypothetical protein